MTEGRRRSGEGVEEKMFLKFDSRTLKLFLFLLFVYGLCFEKFSNNLVHYIWRYSYIIAYDTYMQ